ncbi:MAG TPA: hypothetical protein DEB39_14080 [Planctomycetaceae bacterium]|nr:hypothetical protein [Planctomycetaceae bacterium]
MTRETPASKYRAILAGKTVVIDVVHVIVGPLREGTTNMSHRPPPCFSRLKNQSPCACYTPCSCCVWKFKRLETRAKSKRTEA